jgi:hypothetical protein
MRKERGDSIRVIPAAIQFRTICSFVCCLNPVKIRIYESIILIVVFYWCETLSLTLREQHRLREFGKLVLRGISCLNRNNIIGRIKLHNEELLFSSKKVITF